MNKLHLYSVVACIGLAVGTGGDAAHACGGLFCSAAQPVNQAAERIIFANNGDGTVTAVIQILYEGPASEFSWLLPISTVPTGDKIQVSSDLAFTRLQAATNPQYTLTTRVEGACASFGDDEAETDVIAESDGTPPPGTMAPVMVVGSGNVGPFAWTAISVDENTEAPADAAVEWLQQNDYYVPEGSAALLGPYLEDGLYLLALRLTKDADAGSIRPIVLTYDAERPMIPIKLTAVAANDDMGVLTWLLGDGRGVPENYLELELNEARINWFNPGSTYGQVVNEAADHAGGQGFVTEYAQDTSELPGVVWSDFDAEQWQAFREAAYGSLQDTFNAAYYQWAEYDGFWDAVSATVTLPAQVSDEDFKICPDCYSAELQFSPSEFMAALEAEVVEPMRATQELLDSHPKITRLYTTLSAAEMTLDPLFTFNSDLPDVSNVHTAERVIECNDDIEQFEAPWRIELPQGGIVRGVGQGWPSALDQLVPNRVIKRQGASGDGKLIEDNSAAIEADLEVYNQSVPSGLRDEDSSSDSDGNATSSSEPGDEPASSADPKPSAQDDVDDDDGCSFTSPTASGSAVTAPWLALFALASLARRRSKRG